MALQDATLQQPRAEENDIKAPSDVPNKIEK
jgi:hypothetical protein